MDGSSSFYKCVSVCVRVQLSVVVPLGGWISRRMAIILISTNYVCFQLTTQLAVTSLAVFLSHARPLSVFLSAMPTLNTVSPSCLATESR